MIVFNCLVEMVKNVYFTDQTHENLSIVFGMHMFQGWTIQVKSLTSRYIVPEWRNNEDNISFR